MNGTQHTNNRSQAEIFSWQNNYSSVLNQALIQDLLDDRQVNSWLFLGGKATQGDYATLQLARNYVGHFEEAYRWQYLTENESSRERFVINGSRPGQALNETLQQWSTYTQAYQHKTTAYLFDEEDAAYYQQKDMTKDLDQLIHLAHAQINNTGILVVQLPYYIANPYGQEDDPRQALRYKVLSYIHTLPEATRKRLLVVDHFHLSHTENWTEGLTRDGQLNPLGHLRLAKQLITTVFGYTKDILPYSRLKAVPTKNNTIDTVQPVYQTQAAPNSEKIQALIAQDKPLRWLFMGDSITHGALHTDGYESVAQIFEKYVHHDLKRPHDLVFNTGVSGATTQSTLAAIDHRLHDFQADVAIIMLGTNDLKMLSTQEFESHYRQLLDQLSRRDIPLVLRSLPPAFKEDWQDVTDKHGAYHQITAQLAHDYQAAFVDQLYLFEDLLNKYPYLRLPEFGVFNDSGIHPSYRGQMIMAKQLVRALGLPTVGTELMKHDFAIEFEDIYLEGDVEVAIGDVVYVMETDDARFETRQLVEIEEAHWLTEYAYARNKAQRFIRRKRC
ncbi:SGNH/GDSL hydrolase family protein [Fundicoccus culcitae]|uniref:SGNH/GDSL hydrolase family protein n=1 Tax=Fundicoccus culcitae TaxID=2969821 RepID=A0ABY5P973_9LACT|nr:SGNH/GDSL hydrolase family protein [Fundicoccus culcitae]UUX35297.1 SGNH/GDSL hydrolase family protein [Fundicoccus culcitae]